MLYCNHQKSFSNCDHCRFKQICLPLSLQPQEVAQLDKIIQPKILHKGEVLYTQGSCFKSLYAIRTGSIKLVRVTQNGFEEMENFFLAGELVGLDGLASPAYLNAAIALDTTSVCQIKYREFTELAAQISILSHNLVSIMGREIGKNQNWRVLIARGTAEEKIATLLTSILLRFEHQGLNTHQLNLPLSRLEMSNLLGLTKETVSRVLGKLQLSGLFVLSGRRLEIIDRNALFDHSLPEITLC